jgi:hypothetical protein
MNARDFSATANVAVDMQKNRGYFEGGLLCLTPARETRRAFSIPQRPISPRLLIAATKQGRAFRLPVGSSPTGGR